MTQIIFIQGPPRSGKDLTGFLLTQHLYTLGIRAKTYKFADPIVEWSESFFGVSCRNDEIKDAPHPDLHGRTPRQVAIQFSEEMMKPAFGPAVFGKVLTRKIDMDAMDFAIITDSGFREEATPVYDHFGLDVCTALQIERPGTDFKNDSRDYWRLPVPGHTARFNNMGDDARKLQKRIGCLWTGLQERGDV